MSKESSRLISLIVKSDVKCRDYNFDYVNLHRLSLSMNLLNLAGLKNYFMAAYLIRIRKYLMARSQEEEEALLLWLGYRGAWPGRWSLIFLARAQSTCHKSIPSYFCLGVTKRECYMSTYFQENQGSRIEGRVKKNYEIFHIISFPSLILGVLLEKDARKYWMKGFFQSFNTIIDSAWLASDTGSKIWCDDVNFFFQNKKLL